MECLLLSELSQVRVRINLKRIIDENGILKNEIAANSSNEVYFSLQLYSHGKAQGTQQCSAFFVPKSLFDEPIIFNYLYADLTLEAKVAISIWSSAKKSSPHKPLGSTVIQLFDEKGELRQGKYHLFIWPNQAPDCEDPSSTPGLANDENIETLNFISDRLEECAKSNDPHSSKAEQTLKFRLSYIYRLIPAAFLEVEFPKFELPLFFADKLSPDYEEATFPEGLKSEIAQCLQIYDADQEKEAPNPFEEMYYALKSEKEAFSESAAPTKEQMRELQAIASKSFRIEIKTAERETLFKFRNYLVQDRKYLAYFLNSLPPQYDAEQELHRLLAKWQRADQADALYLLSRDFSLNPAYNRRKYHLPIINIIRDYAVGVIAELKDQELTYLLLFLVQALRYEGEGFQSTLLALLFQRAAGNSQIASLLYWYLKTESEPLPPSKDSKAAKEGEKNLRLFQSFFGKFQLFLQENNPEVQAMIGRQTRLFETLKSLAKSVKEAKDKKGELRKRLAEVDWSAVGNVCYPMDVSVVLAHPLIEECTVFSSAMAPMKLTFAAGEGRFSFLFKSGDDLRQDQMVLEMFDLMDRLLKGVNQDYKLTPYKALACSKTDGFVEFVPETRTFQETELKKYLQRLVEEKSGEVMQNYVFSCAGYCAITYFFGIGDRHLENLLISSSGKMLHIDFGFILGRDPKPYPPPIKIRKDMIEAMGGLEHSNFKQFKAKCLEAFLYLRKHGKVVYNLVYLMLDSGLKDVHPEGIAKLFDKFAVTMNDTEAEKHFLMVLEECKNAIAAIIADGIHRWASHFK